MIRPLLVVSSLLLSGAALAAGPLDGSWKLATKVGAKGLNSTVFRFVGTDTTKGKVFVRMDGEFGPGQKRGVNITGTYTLSNGLIQMKFTGAKMDEKTMAAAERKKFADPKVRAQFSSAFTRSNPPAYAVKRMGTKTVTLVPQGSKDPKEPTLVLKRVK